MKQTEVGLSYLLVPSVLESDYDCKVSAHMSIIECLEYVSVYCGLTYSSEGENVFVSCCKPCGSIPFYVNRVYTEELAKHSKVGR